MSGDIKGVWSRQFNCIEANCTVCRGKEEEREEAICSYHSCQTGSGDHNAMH